jgi:hypothetical protein
MPFVVYSTATNPTRYVEYNPRDGENDKRLPTVKRGVVIQGGAGLPAKKTLITPFGVSTVVSDTDMEWLETVPAFQRHKAAGFIKVTKQLTDDEVATADMNRRDGSSPIVPQDYLPDGSGKTVGDIEGNKPDDKPLPKFGK